MVRTHVENEDVKEVVKSWKDMRADLMLHLEDKEREWPDIWRPYGQKTFSEMSA